MSFEVSKLIFSCIESLLYLFCINFVLPIKFDLNIKKNLIQFVVIVLAVYFFLNNNLISILVFHTILILLVYFINKIELYSACISILIIYITFLISSLISIIIGIFIFNEKIDFRYVLVDAHYEVILIKIIISIIFIYIYKMFNSLFSKKILTQKINPRIVILVNFVFVIVVFYLTCLLLNYIPEIYFEIVKIGSLTSLVSTGIITAYIASISIMYIINIYLFKSSDYISIKLSSERDAMTGVLNRKAGLNFLKSRMQKIQVRKGFLTVCFVDVNNLKTVNDKYGHKEGDKLINSVAKLIKSSLRDHDDIARLGGDEFLVVFDNCSIEKAVGVWDRILEKFDTFNLTQRLDYDVSVSVGFSEYNHNMNINHETLIEIADAEMYKNKEHFKKIKGSSRDVKW